VTHLVTFTAVVGTWGLQAFPIAALNKNEIIATAILGIGSPYAYLTFSHAVRRAPSFAIASQYLEPVFGIALGCAAFNESLSFVQATGAAVIVASTAALTRAERPVE
jgi:drug/metabolite transporter (DMT)-like permease